MQNRSYSRIIALIMSGIMASTFASIPVYAYDYPEEEIVEESYALANSTYSTLSIRNNQATLDSGVDGDTCVVSVSATQTLEKFVALWIWSPVSGASWSKSKSGKSLEMHNQATLYESGTYRVKTVFTLTSNTGSTETITVYSNEVTI